MEKDKFRKLFPHLAAEMESDISKISQKKIEEKSTESERGKRKWAKYNPTIIDFIRRCDTKEQAEEIINYMESKSEISICEAQKLRKKLGEHGLNSFGKKKEQGYYDKDT